MKFARIVFLIAGVHGLIALLPLYFMESQMGQDYAPPITHPEFYYGFIGVAVAWQLVFLAMSRDPVRFRPLMLPAIVEKASFLIPVIVLYLQHRVSSFMLGMASVDGVLGVLFFLSFLKCRSARS
jgi:hypothetical protein